MDWHELLEEILDGFKKIGIFILVMVLGAGIVWGFLSILLIISGVLPFSWWHMPCWLLSLCMIAGIVGECESD